MPKALNADRELAKQLFIQGLKTDEIGQRLGVNKLTVGTWCRRYGWRKLKSNIVTTMTREVKQPMLSNQVAAQSIALRQSLSAKLAEARVVLEQSAPPASLKALQTQQAQISLLIDNARKVFGWDQSIATSIVSARKLSEYDPLPSQPENALLDTAATVSPDAVESLPRSEQTIN